MFAKIVRTTHCCVTQQGRTCLCCVRLIKSSSCHCHSWSKINHYLIVLDWSYCCLYFKLHMKAILCENNELWSLLISIKLWLSGIFKITSLIILMGIKYWPQPGKYLIVHTAQAFLPQVRNLKFRTLYFFFASISIHFLVDFQTRSKLKCCFSGDFFFQAIIGSISNHFESRHAI